MNKIKSIKNKNLIIIIFINLIIFGITNILFNIKYEQVDDFIIYNLYSGLDGTYNIHGIYIHPIICLIISIFYRILPIINWHSIFLLIMQFICFTIIGNIILKKHNNGIAIVLYTIFASIFYVTMLMLIQYTSVSALLILTSLIILIYILDKNEKTKIKCIIGMYILYTIGIMTRMQSLLIIIPFFGLYFVINLVKYKFQKQIQKDTIIKIVKYYLIYILITIRVYVSNIIIYNSDEIYINYMEYNDTRATLHDIIYVDYEKNKEIFDEIGWSKNDHYLFYTFNFGDENIYSKENLEKILDYKIQKDGKYNFDTNIAKINENFISEATDSITYISILFITIFIIGLFKSNKTKENILIFIATIGMHILFILIGRSMLRVVIPEYIIGTALLIYNLNFNNPKKVKENKYIQINENETDNIKNSSEKQNKKTINDSTKNCTIICFMILIICTFVGNKYNYGYDLENYKNYRELINYTNNHKENVYLYTVPSLQDRYLTYSVYQMPPKGAFSNLRVMGGWDMYTQNYYDFKERYNLEGNFLDLLKENVYLIDGDVYWSGRRYENYKENVVLSIKENYNTEVTYEEVEQFGNLAIYKIVQN